MQKTINPFANTLQLFTPTKLWQRFLQTILVALFFSSLALAQTLICPDASASSSDQLAPFTTAWKNNLPTGQKTIPVVVHLIGTATGISPSQVNIALSQLNADFNSANPDWDIDFRLATVDPNGKCTNGITMRGDLLPNSFFKPLTIWPNKSYLNIWVVEIVNGDPNALGVVEELPTKYIENLTCDGMDRTDLVAGNNGPFDTQDGVVIKREAFYPNNSDQHTLTHETAHWLNVLHVFQADPVGNNNGCGYWTNCHPLSELTTNGDFIEDTNPQDQVQSGNPADCSGNHLGECSGLVGVAANLDNYMNYAHPCQDKFTQGQREWMFACLSVNRPFIWADENLRCTGVYPESNNISGSVFWDFTTKPTGFVQVLNEIHILNNATLTIAPGITVQFCDHAKLVVDPGGHLILNGKLTNSCDRKMWQGVVVMGSATSNTQWPTNIGFAQGRLTANPGSIIENAVVAIWVGSSLGSGGGGIIRCTGTTFLNNQKAVQFEPFENHLPLPSSPVTSNFSHFDICDFITDAGYLGDSPVIYEPADFLKFIAFADLRGVRGIRFSGCDFSNLRTDDFPASAYGIGILSSESGFTVSNFCTSSSPSPGSCPANNQIKSTFKNLYQGIYVGKTDIDSVLAKFYTIQSCLFQGCWIGVHSELGSRGVIVQNTFKIGDVPIFDLIPEIFGVLLQYKHSTFTLQENNFERAENILQDVQDISQLIGSRAYYILETDNLIRKNYYKNLTIGNEAVGDNTNFFGFTGLRYLCNENQNNNTYDFNVRVGKGIRNIQGTLEIVPPIETRIPAGNIFSHINLPESDFRNEGQNAVNYYHRQLIPETPLTFTTPIQVVLEFTSSDKQCESIYCNPPCRSEQQLSLEKQSIVTAKTEFNNVYSSFLQHPNGPNAGAQKISMAALQEIIQTNTFDVLLHIIANEGSLSDYRYWLGYMDAYETDLELANSYIGTGEFAQANAFLSSLPTKHNLSGEMLTEFSDYRAVLNVMQTHLQSGGSKFNLPTTDINSLKNYAENNVHVSVRGQAKAMLAMYGILYPPEQVNESGNRAGQRTQSRTDGFRLAPNPADQTVWVIFPHIDSLSDHIGQLSIYSIHGRLLHQQETLVAEGGVQLSLAGQPEGCYFIQVRLSNGEFATLPLVIAH